MEVEILFYGVAQRSREKIATNSLAEGNAQIIINC